MIQPLTLDTTPLTFAEKVRILQAADRCHIHMWRAVEAATSADAERIALDTWKSAREHYQSLVREFGSEVYAAAHA